MRNDDALDLRPETTMGQAAISLVFQFVGDEAKMNKIMTTPRRASQDVETISIQDGVILFNEGYVMRTRRQGDGLDILAQEILSCLTG